MDCAAAHGEQRIAQTVIRQTLLHRRHGGVGREQRHAIRTETDTCVVAILDERAAKGKRYSKDVLAALPEMPVTGPFLWVPTTLPHLIGNIQRYSQTVWGRYLSRASPVTGSLEDVARFIRQVKGPDYFREASA